MEIDEETVVVVDLDGEGREGLVAEINANNYKLDYKHGGRKIIFLPPCYKLVLARTKNTGSSHRG